MQNARPTGDGLEATLTPANCAALQREWAREASVPKVADIRLEHGGATATNSALELQLVAGGRRS